MSHHNGALFRIPSASSAIGCTTMLKRKESDVSGVDIGLTLTSISIYIQKITKKVPAIFVDDKIFKADPFSYGE